MSAVAKRSSSSKNARPVDENMPAGPITDFNKGATNSNAGTRLPKRKPNAPTSIGFIVDATLSPSRISNVAMPSFYEGMRTYNPMFLSSTAGFPSSSPRRPFGVNTSNGNSPANGFNGCTNNNYAFLGKTTTSSFPAFSTTPTCFNQSMHPPTSPSVQNITHTFGGFNMTRPMSSAENSANKSTTSSSSKVAQQIPKSSPMDCSPLQPTSASKTNIMSPNSRPGSAIAQKRFANFAQVAGSPRGMNYAPAMSSPLSQFSKAPSSNKLSVGGSLFKRADGTQIQPEPMLKRQGAMQKTTTATTAVVETSKANAVHVSPVKEEAVVDKMVESPKAVVEASTCAKDVAVEMEKKAEEKINEEGKKEQVENAKPQEKDEVAKTDADKESAEHGSKISRGRGKKRTDSVRQNTTEEPEDVSPRTLRPRTIRKTYKC